MSTHFNSSEYYSLADLLDLNADQSKICSAKQGAREHEQAQKIKASIQAREIPQKLAEQERGKEERARHKERILLDKKRHRETRIISIVAILISLAVAMIK